MLAYPIEEAEELLKSKLSTAKNSMANCEEDMDFIREQITVSLCIPGALLTQHTHANTTADYGSCYSPCIQLGGYAKAKRQKGWCGRRKGSRQRGRSEQKQLKQTVYCYTERPYPILSISKIHKLELFT